MLLLMKEISLINLWRHDLKTNYSIRKTATCQWDDWLLLDYLYFKKYCELVAIDLNKQQKLDADP